MQNFSLVVFTKLGNSRDDDGKCESHIVFYYDYCESKTLLFYIAKG